MYSLPQVYGDKPFERSYLPTCMYSVAPYYETTTSPSPAMASILPLPLLPTDSLDLADSNIKNTLEDVLSRQMLLLCRLNQLEQQLLQQHQTITAETPPEVKSPSVSVPPTLLEDIAVHFPLDAVPYSLFALLAALRKKSGVLVNLHLHSSVASQPRVHSAVAELKNLLAARLNFTFSTTDQYLTRAQYPLIVTCIVTSSSTNARASFGQTVVEGELAIARRLLQLLNADLAGSEGIWSLLTNPATLASDKAILEQLGPAVFALSSNTFLLNQSSPTLLDVILWSLTVPEFTRRLGSVASSLRGVQLLNSKWQSAVGQFVVSA